MKGQQTVDQVVWLLIKLNVLLAIRFVGEVTKTISLEEHREQKRCQDLDFNNALRVSFKTFIEHEVLLVDLVDSFVIKVILGDASHYAVI